MTDHTLERLALFDRDAFEFVTVAVGVFTTFTGVALAANAVHGHRQRGMGFGADRAERHGARGKSLDNVFGQLDLLQRNGLGGVNFELEQTTQRHVTLALVIDQLGIFFVSVPVVGARAVLQLGDGIWAPHMLFATGAPGVFSAGVQHVGQHRIVAKCSFVGADRFFGNVEHADALNTACSTGEVLGNGVAGQANGFKQLCSAVAHVGGHAHLGHDLGQALANGLDVVVNGFVGAQISRQVLVDFGQGFHREVGVDSFCPITCQHSEVMYFARCARLHNQTCCGAQAFFHQMLVNSA